MKDDTRQVQWKNGESSPVYQCPQCRTRWLIIGLESRHTCNACGHAFDPAEAQLDIEEMASHGGASWTDAA